MKPRNTEKEKKVSNRIMFGKYAGKLWSEVPTEYLQWFSNIKEFAITTRVFGVSTERKHFGTGLNPLSPPSQNR